MENKRVCAICGCELEIPTKRQEKKMKKEYKKRYPNDPNMEDIVDVVCDDCDKEFMEWFEHLKPIQKALMEREANER